MDLFYPKPQKPNQKPRITQKNQALKNTQINCNNTRVFRSSVFILFIFSFFGLNAQNEAEVLEFSLESAQDYAVQHNVEVLNKQLDIEVAKGRVKEYTAIGLPQVNAGIDFQHFITLPTTILPGSFSPQQELVLVRDVNDEVKGIATPVIDTETGQPIPGPDLEVAFGTKNTLTGKIEASQLVFSGSYLKGLQASRTYVNFAKKDLTQKATEVKNNVANAFFGVLVIQENIKLLEQNVTILDKILFETTELWKNGFVEEIEVDRLTLSKANLTTQINNLQRQESAAKDALKLTMGIDLETQITLTENLEGLMEMDLAEIPETVNPSKRPEYQTLNIQGQLNDLQIAEIKSRRLPTVAAFASYQQSFQNNSLNIFQENVWFPAFLVGFNISVPIFDGFQKDGLLQQKRLAAKQVVNAKNLLSQSFNFELNQAKTSYNNAINSLNNQKKNLELAQKIYDVATIKYREGLGSSLEVINAESQLYETQGLYINALYDVVVSKNQLQKAVGGY